MARNAFGGSVSDYVVSFYTLGSSKLAAFTAKTNAGDPSASSPAPIAGPAMTVTFSIVPFSALAAVSSRSPATCGISAETGQ